jgi:hypothetical protein
VGPLEVTIRVPRKPRAVVRWPSGEQLAVSYGEGKARVSIARVAIHDVLAVQA